jgi:hypothetical protein
MLDMLTRHAVHPGWLCSLRWVAMLAIPPRLASYARWHLWMDMQAGYICYALCRALLAVLPGWLC